ncbi:MAG: tetratricopeptide repeat protein [Planctomycetota bacterium]
MIRATVAGLCLGAACAGLDRWNPTTSLLSAARAGALGALFAGCVFLPVTLLEGALSRAGRRPGSLRGVLLLFLAAYLGLLRGIVQLDYLTTLLSSGSVGEAIHRAFVHLSGQRWGMLGSLALVALGLAAASSRRLGWLDPNRRVWVLALSLGAACLWASRQAGSPWRGLALLPGVVAMVAVLASIVASLATKLQQRLSPSDRLDPVDEDLRGAPPPLHVGDRLVMGGGPSMFPASFLWAAAGLYVAQDQGPGWGLLFVLGFLVHAIAAGNLPNGYLRRGQPQRALDLARHLLAYHARRQRPGHERVLRVYRDVEVRSLLRLGRHDEALGLLPRALPDAGDESVRARAMRLRLAQALTETGHPARALEVLEPVSPEGALALNLTVLQAVALGALDQPADALALTRGLLDQPALRGRSRAVVLNNLAVFHLAAGGEPAQALEWARAASALAPAVARGTLGLALGAAGQHEAALPLLEATRAAPRSPHGFATASLALGRSYEALARSAEARAAYQEAIARLPDSAPGREAAARLTALARAPLEAVAPEAPEGPGS